MRCSRRGKKATGIVLFLVGLTCMPIPLTNPKAMPSLFPVLASASFLVRYGAVMIVLGALLFGSSFLIRQRL
jgi:hypothetical protein